MQPDCSQFFKQLFQSSSSSAWADLKAADCSIDIPKNKYLKASVEVYLELLHDIINYWISVPIFETVSHWNMGPKGKCKVTEWQFDVIITEKVLEAHFQKDLQREMPLSNWIFYQRNVYRHSSVSWRKKKKLYKCNQFQVLKVLVYYLLVSELLLKCIFNFFDQLMASTAFLST